MKLIYCNKCRDVVRLIVEKWRTCKCKSIGGQYNSEGLTATISGEGKIIGIPNTFFMDDFKKIHDLKWKNHKKFHDELKKFRKKFGYLHNESEAWFGEHKGEWQVFRIKNPSGPRLSDKAVRNRIRKLFKKYKLSKKQIENNWIEFNNNKIVSNLAKNYDDTKRKNKRNIKKTH